jgi:PKD repeat protein
MLDGPYYGNTGEAFTFDASDSFDHEGDIISYEWDFGDDNTGTGATITHTYSDPGAYLVSLILTDDDGNIANDTTWAFIDRTNSAPNPPTISGETEGKNGTTYNYTFTSLDPEGDDVYYYIFWGAFNWEGWYGPYTSDEEVIYSHMWPQNETYIIHAKSKDKYGAESDWTTLEVKMERGKFKDISSIKFFNSYLYSFPLLRLLLLKL